MNIFKKFLPLSLLFLMLLTSCNNSNTSNNTNNEDDNPQGLAFYLLDDGTYGVGRGYASQLSHITIPEKYKNKDVTTIVEYGFAYGRAVNPSPSYKTKSVTIPKSIKHIENYAFDSFEEIEYLGTMNEFKSIEYDGYFFSDYNDYYDSSLTKFKFSDRQIGLIESYNYLKAKFGWDESCSRDGDTKTLSMVSKYSYSSPKNIELCVYRTSLLGEPFDKDYPLESRDISVSISNNDNDSVSYNAEGRSLSLIDEGKPDLKITYSNISIDIHLNITPLPLIQLPSELIFESQTFSYDGEYHHLEEIQNVPEDLFVFYAVATPTQLPYHYEEFKHLSEVNNHGFLLWSKDIGVVTEYAYFYKVGYELTYLTATLTIVEG